MRSDILVPTVPAVLILIACSGWSTAAWVALAYLTVGTAIIDVFATRSSQGKPASDGVSLFLGCLHFAVLLASIVTIAAVPGDQVWPLFLATGLYLGQVSNGAAHELIHSRASIPRTVGRWVYISMLFGHHASAHPKIHHRFVATPQDPNSARPGESLYAFLPRAWVGSFRRGLSAEADAIRTKGRRASSLRNPYWTYTLGAVALLVVSYLFAGATGVAIHAALSCWATTQLLAADYVQHYGLRRRKRDAGYEPIGVQHSWNAPMIASTLLMHQAPIHSSHHIGHDTADTVETQPNLPYSLPAMVTLAFFPRAFRRVMDRALANLEVPEESFDKTVLEIPA